MYKALKSDLGCPWCGCHDVALVCGGYFSCADDTIDQLIKTGIVTPEQVVHALNTFLEQS